MKISAKSDVGKVRSSNQDFYAAGELAEGVTWAVVCDGMGGANGGNIASETAVNTIAEKLSSGYHSGMNDNSVKNLIISSVEAANATVYSRAASDKELSGMGTTAVLVIISRDTLYLANVGDSRIYIVGGDSINQVTTDHSIVQMMLERGEITHQEAKEHPSKNVITRALGVSETVLIDYDQLSFNDGDIVLLCSDGLTNYVDDDTVFEVCTSADRYSIAQRLIDLANENGGGDNVTVVTLSN